MLARVTDSDAPEAGTSPALTPGANIAISSAPDGVTAHTVDRFGEA